MIRLRGIPSAAAEMMLNIHNDIFDVAQALLRENNFVIFEEALVRAGKLRYRKDIQWQAMRDELQAHFQCDVMNISCATFREGCNSKFDALPTLARVKEFLRKGNGNETAGFGFVHWKRDVTERKIAARRNTSVGIAKSADHLQMAMEQALQITQHAEDAGP
jgi:hypothetical protein